MTPPMPDPTTLITTDRLTIRSISMDDLPAFCEVFTDPAVMRYIGDGSIRDPDTIRDRMRQAIDLEQKTGLAFWTALLNKPDPAAGAPAGAIIGDCGLVPIARIGPEIEIGYRLARRFWGRGYATEAARAVLHHAFTTLRLDKVIAVTIPENYPSQHVLAKIGLRRVGLTDKHYDTTTMLFELSRDEYLDAQQP